MALEISDAQFEKEVIEQSNEEKIVVDFWAPWCGPCQMIGPILEDVCEENDVKLVKLNVDENKQVAQKFGIRGIPAVKIFEDGEIADEFTGVQPEAQIREFVKN